MASDLLFGLLPEHLLLALILVLMVLEIFRANRTLSGLLYLLTLSTGMGVLLYQLSSGYTLTLVPGEVIVDRFAILAKLVVLACGTLLGFFYLTASSTHKSWMLITCSLLGALVIMDSAGFISLFIGIEMLSLPGFALMIHGRKASVSSEGAFKYLLLSSVATALLLFGVSLVYSQTGTLAIADFAAALSKGGAQNWAAGAMVLTAFFIKASVFPFHGWAPDAYDSAKLPVTAFLSSVVKAAIVLALVRIVANMPLNDQSVMTVTILSVCSIFYGNIAAIRQTTFKRLLAYSSIAHAGYMMFALSDATGGRVEALFYYTAVYAVTTIIACASFSLLCDGEEDKLEIIEGAFYRRPVPALILATAALSLAGIPPLPGFLAKVFVFKSVIASGHLVPAVLAFTGSYLGVVYYLSIVFRLFKKAEVTEEAGAAQAGSWTWGGVVLGTGVLAALMICPDLFHRLLSIV
ncbi:NADH-quinone oxidoreductase subunit N [Geomonas sp. RF6]|uniref:NADH-quinone oxidoreductase subunit N n=1 Tax=Geomonas sp. RF6 TaxID=2897342 RepID=UPI001E520A63|nr:NADH-quinone oxidoreductase subunit N [Geomonas sp. RF6]UFS72583.1 NADH-quinone oxidoreductase subunit N [Geomonas sp. RF6]